MSLEELCVVEHECGEAGSAAARPLSSCRIETELAGAMLVAGHAQVVAENICPSGHIRELRLKRNCVEYFLP